MLLGCTCWLARAQSLLRVAAEPLPVSLALGRMAQRPLRKALDSRQCAPIIGEYTQLHPGYANLVVRNPSGCSERGALACKRSLCQQAADLVLLNTRETADFVGGSLSIEAVPRRGTQVLMEIDPSFEVAPW